MTERDGLDLSLIVSTEVKLPNGNTRMFPELRQITLGRRENRWFVVKDEVLLRG
jgi:hypothetical protein